MPVILDYDGVMFEARWYEERINLPGDIKEQLYEAMKKGENLFTKPLPIVQSFVKKLKNRKVCFNGYI